MTKSFISREIKVFEVDTDTPASTYEVSSTKVPFIPGPITANHSQVFVGGKEPCGIYVFEWDRATSTLVLTDTVYNTNGWSPTYITRSENVLMSAFYHEGAVLTHMMGKTDAPACKKDGLPGCHAISVVKPRIVLCPILRADKIVTFDVDLSTGELTYKSEVVDAKDSGPRHIALSSAKDCVFVLHELTGDVTVQRISPGANLAAVSSIRYDMMPSGWQEKKWAAEIKQVNDKYLITSDRASSSLCLFKINDTYELTRLSVLETEKQPRSFDIVQNALVCVAGQLSDHIAVYRIADDRLELMIRCPVGEVGPMWVHTIQ